MRLILIVALLGLLLPGCSNTDPWDPGIPNIPRTDVYITNLSAERILEVYVRWDGGSEWGENWLTAPVAGGNLYAFLAELISGTYDFRMVGEATTQELMDISCVGNAIGISFHAPTAALAGADG